jgi:hypothetical protein
MGPRKNQPPGIGFVADHGGNLRTVLVAPTLALCSFNDGRHVGATARDQNDNVFHITSLRL